MTAVARAEDRAASLALEAISGRTINLAVGVVIHQNGLAPDDAEDLLRQSARLAGIDLAQLAASVVRSGELDDPPTARRASGFSRPRASATVRSLGTAPRRKSSGR